MTVEAGSHSQAVGPLRLLQAPRSCASLVTLRGRGQDWGQSWPAQDRRGEADRGLFPCISRRQLPAFPPNDHDWYEKVPSDRLPTGSLGRPQPPHPHVRDIPETVSLFALAAGGLTAKAVTHL